MGLRCRHNAAWVQSRSAAAGPADRLGESASQAPARAYVSSRTWVSPSEFNIGYLSRIYVDTQGFLDPLPRAAVIGNPINLFDLQVPPLRV